MKERDELYRASDTDPVGWLLNLPTEPPLAPGIADLRARVERAVANMNEPEPELPPIEPSKSSGFETGTRTDPTTSIDRRFARMNETLGTIQTTHQSMIRDLESIGSDLKLLIEVFELHDRMRRRS